MKRQTVWPVAVVALLAVGTPPLTRPARTSASATPIIPALDVSTKTACFAAGRANNGGTEAITIRSSLGVVSDVADGAVLVRR